MISMTRKLLIGSLLLATPWVVTQAGNRDHFDYAKVTKVRPIYETVQVASPVQQCWDEQVTRSAAGRRSYTGVILGSIIGGAIGSEVGHGRHRDVVTVAGAVLGGSIANDLHYRNQRTTTTTTIERQCKTVQNYHAEQRKVGYQVQYRYAGKSYTTRMNHAPGKRVRVAVSVQLAE